MSPKLALPALVSLFGGHPRLMIAGRRCNNNIIVGVEWSVCCRSWLASAANNENWSNIAQPQPKHDV